MHIRSAIRDRILGHLTFLYGAQRAQATWQCLQAIMAAFQRRNPSHTPGPQLSERDAVLITYADQFQEPGVPPLQTLHSVLTEALACPTSGLHILPFFPYSSDDGFSVIDYTQVNPAHGTWEDIEALGRHFRLMFDSVVNHVSQHSDWFQRFLQRDVQYANWFITVEPGTDLSGVVRPRALPLIHKYRSVDGDKWIWTTFSQDQIDLNYANPDVLLRMIEILLVYIERGAQIIRLDAVAYLWKEIGTSCIHLPQAHRVVKLLRAITDALAPGVLWITETNVPHQDNVSYFGEPLPGTDASDEAHLVYQFPLPPLVMYSILSGDASVLSQWAAGLETPAGQATFFNFTASHDGIGLTPARGLLTGAQVQTLIDATLAHGGHVSHGDQPDGSRAVYELNISYFDALSDPAAAEPLALQVQRFACSQAVMLALSGVPGVYVHSLLGSRSWHEGVERTGRNRTINRRKLERGALERELREPTSLRHQVYRAYRQLLRARTSDPAFHPYGSQRVLTLSDTVFALLRTSPGGESQVLCLHNLSGEAQRLRCAPSELGLPTGPWQDLLHVGAGIVGSAACTIELPPYAVRWLKACRELAAEPTL